MINTTHLRRRVAKYLGDHSGGKHQTGETAFGLASCGDQQFVRHLRRGVQMGETKLAKVDGYLRSRGY